MVLAQIIPWRQSTTMKKMTMVSHSVASDFKHACAISICFAFFLLFVIFDWDPIFQGKFFPGASSSSSRERQRDWSQASHTQADSVRKLTADIRAATGFASGGSYQELSAAEEREWRIRNPCKSRSELVPMYDQRKHVNKLPGNAYLDEVMTEYSKLHRTCMQKLAAAESNVTEFFLGNRTLPGCKFIVGSPMYGTGLGNKMVVTASALLYAILTQRVLLVPLRTHLPKFMCEPFVGSSWALDTSTFPMPDGKVGRLPWEPPEINKSKEWTEDTDFLQAMDGWLVEKNIPSNNSDNWLQQPPSLAYAMSVTIRWQPDNRFYCGTEQRMVSEVQWLYWGGCIYSVPKIFASPVFGPTVRALFPDNMVITRLLRMALLPGDVVFGKFRQLNHDLFQRTDRRIGIQLRSLKGKDFYEKVYADIHRRVLSCVIENGILPNASSNIPSLRHGDGTSSTKVYIASLYKGLRDYLNDFYSHKSTVAGENIEIIQVSNNEEQQLGVDEDIQAFVEILLLSLSDQLLVTPSSTFGSIAQAYGALTPWFIETREDSDKKVYGSCERAQSIDICHQFTKKVYQCPHDPSIDGKIIVDRKPAIKGCKNIDHNSGLQLISTFKSDS